MVALGIASPAAISLSPQVEPMKFETVSLSKQEIDYPAMRAMHEASSLESEEEVVDWHAAAQQETAATKDDGEKEARLFFLEPLDDDGVPRDTIEEVIQRRGSTREFSTDSISFAQLSTMLDRATRGISTDFQK